MIEEVNNAIGFLSKIMNSPRIPRQTIENFVQSLAAVLHEHYDNHWFPEKPVKGSGYRCLRIVNKKMDPLFAKAGRISGLSVNHLLQLLPAEFTMWIDPDEVSYRIGEDGSIGVVYSADTHDSSDSDSSDSQSSADSVEQTSYIYENCNNNANIPNSSMYMRPQLHHHPQAFRRFNMNYLTAQVVN